MHLVIAELAALIRPAYCKFAEDLCGFASSISRFYVFFSHDRRLRNANLKYVYHLIYFFAFTYSFTDCYLDAKFITLNKMILMSSVMRGLIEGVSCCETEPAEFDIGEELQLQSEIATTSLESSVTLNV